MGGFVVPVIEILVSPDAGWMTGAVIPLDGGQVLDIA